MQINLRFFVQPAHFPEIPQTDTCSTILYRKTCTSQLVQDSRVCVTPIIHEYRGKLLEFLITIKHLHIYIHTDVHETKYGILNSIIGD